MDCPDEWASISRNSIKRTYQMIVWSDPAQAMALGCPVIAVASGGPLETVLDGETGFLCEAVRPGVPLT